MDNNTENMTAEQYQQHIRANPAGRRKVVPVWKIPLPEPKPEPAGEPLPRTLVTEIVFPYRVVGNNDKNGLIRMKPAERKRLKNLYLKTILAATRHRHTAPVRFELIRHSIGRAMDYDNLVSTGKALTDQLIKAEVIPDDNPDVITQRDYTQTRALSRHTQMTVIRIIDLP